MAERSLANNQLTSLPPGVFEGLVSLQLLYVGWDGLALSVPTYSPFAHEPTTDRSLDENPLLCPLPPICAEAFAFCPICRVCPPDHFYLGDKCRPCPPWSSVSLWIVPILVMVVLHKLYKHAGDVGNLSSVALVISRLQLQLLHFYIDLGWPKLTQDLVRWLRALLLFSLPEFASPECSVDLNSAERWCARGFGGSGGRGVGRGGVEGGSTSRAL